MKFPYIAQVERKWQPAWKWRPTELLILLMEHRKGKPKVFKYPLDDAVVPIAVEKVCNPSGFFGGGIILNPAVIWGGVSRNAVHRS